MSITVHVLATSRELRRALNAGLQRAPGLLLREDEPGAAEVIVAPVADCPPSRCAMLTSAGARVIILAPVPRETERLQYGLAGAAAYLPMGGDAGPLLAAIRSAAAVPTVSD